MVKSFVRRADEIKKSAVEYIEKTIDEKGEIIIKELKDDEDEDDYEEDNCDDLCVLCYEYFSGEPFNVVVYKIKSNSIVGKDNEWGNEVEVPSCDWGDGTAEWIADYVAKYYGELE